MIKVSVICCTYNRAQFIKEALEQLKQQTLAEIEFIIVDDGSTDNSLNILKEQTGKDKRFVILHSTNNQGPSASRNTALNLIKGEYTGFFDIDDHIPTDYFEKLYTSASSQNADIVYTLYNDTTHLLKKSELFSLYDRICALRNGAIWNKLFKSNKIKNIRFKEGYLCADNLFLIDAINNTQSMYLVDSPRYTYTLQTDSVSTDAKRSNRRKQHILEIAKTICNKGREHNYTEIETKALQDFLVRTFNAYPKDKKWTKSLYAIIGKNYDNNTTKRFSMKLSILKILRILHLISKKSYKEKKHIALIASSKLFSKKWYLSQYPDVKSKKISAAKHYYKYGWKEGRNPSKKFDGNAYLKENYDVAQTGINPLIHYIASGAKEGRTIRNVYGEISQIRSKSFGQKILHILTYPERVKAEYDQVKQEIKTLKRK